MPSRSIFHKNRSQHSLLTTQETSGRRSYQASPIDSPLNSPGFPPASAVSPLGREEEEPDYRFHNPSYRPEDPPPYQAGVARSQSQRSSAPAQHAQNPTIHLVGPPHRQFIEDNPDAYYREAASQPPQKEEPKQKRRFFKLGGHGSSSKEAITTAPAPTRLGRSVSVRRNEPPNPNDYRGPHDQQRWPSDSSSVVYRQSIDQQEAGNGYGVSQNSSQRFPANASGPPIPEKDVLQYGPQSSAQQDSGQGRPYLAGISAGTVQHQHQQDEQQAPEPDTTWENSSRPTQQPAHYRQPSEQYSTTSYQPSPAASNHPPQSFQASPSSATSITSHPLRGPQDPLQQWRQDLHSRSRPTSQHSSFNGPPSPLRPPSRQGESIQEKQGASLPTPNTRGNMPPPGPPQGKLLNEHGQQGQQGRDQGVYQPYNQVSQGQGPRESRPPSYGQLNVNAQGQGFRGTPQPSPMPPQTNPSEQQGRSTPPPSRSRDDLSGLDVAQLLSRHDELQDKYRKVKKYYFDKDAQVQSLQNTLAHTRLAMQRNSLDDDEYSNRLNRLDGAIKDLAFSIRRDWATIPPWLAPYVNKDALTNPTKEMTAVGRAFISRWLVDEILDRYFLPTLEPNLSMQLKIIERNLRRFAAPAQSDEEKEALIARISNWRLATLDGLHETLSASHAMEHRAQLTSQLIEKLTASLGMLLKEPPPPGLQGFVTMIVELAVGIAANLPLESRDVFVTYILPGTPVNEAIMKCEHGTIPPLTNPGEGPPEEGAGKADDGTSMTTTNTDNNAGVDSSETDDSRRPSMASSQQEVGKQPPLQGSIRGETASVQQQQQQQQQQQVQQQQQKKKGMFGGLMASNSNSSGGSSGSTKLTKGGPGGQPQGQQQVQQQQQAPQPPQPPKEEKVRFATFMGCEVRGKVVLVKAPCYTL